MKKSPHGLKLDGRKNVPNQLKDNGLNEVRKENRSENSGLVRIKRNKIVKLERKAQEQLENGSHDKHKKTLQEIEKLKKDIEKYLK